MAEDLIRLWQFPWFDRGLRSHYGLDPRRHIRYDGPAQTLYYVVRRSIPRSLPVGRFAVDEKTLQWMLTVERHGHVADAYIVLVEDWSAPPRTVYCTTARALWDSLERIVPMTGSDNSSYWWINDSGQPQDAWLGPPLKVPPF